VEEVQNLKVLLFPLRRPALAFIALLIMAFIAFTQTDRIEISPAPDELMIERVRIDAVRHTREPAGPSGPSQRTTVAVRLASSTDWPGLTFRFAGAAAGVSIVPPVTFDLSLGSSLQEQARRHREWPNVFPVLDVVGVAQGGEVLVDAQATQASRVRRKRLSEILGYGLLAMALLPGIFLFRRGREIWCHEVQGRCEDDRGKGD
jgi:hypothetical protein